MNNTIAAISTSIGESGIGIIRMSGDNAIEILGKIFSTKGKMTDRRLTFGSIFDPETDQVADQVLAVYMRRPKTYTCEDVVEIHCHGSSIALRKVLNLCYKYGASAAEPGEFTKRAFLNGRLDLAQAEAVIDLIKAKTEKSFNIALVQAEGDISRDVKLIRADIMEILVEMAVNIDYPDEDIEEIVYENLIKKLKAIQIEVKSMVNSFDRGRILKEGVSAAIIGKPNVGKSSLMNALLRESRAIVTHIPGTTRDVIEEVVNIRGIPLVLADTAGIRETDDEVEAIGIEKSKLAFDQARLIIFVLDVASELDSEDRKIIEFLRERRPIIVANKQDKGAVVRREDIEAMIPKGVVVETSLTEGIGLDDIEVAIETVVFEGCVESEGNSIVTSERQRALLERASQSLEQAMSMVGESGPLEFIEVDVRESYEILGEITGETVTDDIIDQVFARFCLGK